MDDPIWAVFALGAAIYCAVQTYRDARRGDRAMAILGAACCLGFLLMPIQTHAVKIDLPAGALSPNR